MRLFAFFFAATLCLAQDPHPVTTAYRTAAGTLLYSAGCAIQTSPEPFVCIPVATIPIDGEIIFADRMFNRKVNLEVRYLARWAQQSLGLSPAIPIIHLANGVELGENHAFHLTIPDLSAGHEDAEIQIWARDKETGELVAQLMVEAPAELGTRMGGLKVQSHYPARIVFTTCAKNYPIPQFLHDRTGFDRPVEYEACPR
jgi:hypothetical protein